MLLTLGLEVLHIDVPFLITLDRHHPKACHHSRRWICPMRRERNKAHVTLRIVSPLMIPSNRQQSCIFTLRPSIWLKRNCGKLGDFSQPLLESLQHQTVTSGLLFRSEGMNRSYFRPGNWHHFRGRIQLHGAGPKRNHGLVQRQIFPLESTQVTHHLGLTVVNVEDFVFEKRRTSY